MEEKGGKIERILSLYTRLVDGKLLNKTALADEFGVNERSIQRDIDDIRDFLEVNEDAGGLYNEIIYDREKKAYRIASVRKMKLTNPEVLAICKILLDSRAFVKSELTDILDRLIENCVPQENQKLVKGMVANEEIHYVQLRHGRKYLNVLWKLAEAIRDSKIIEIRYNKLKGEEQVTRRLWPVAVMFSEYYFYLTAFIDDEKIRECFDVVNDSFPTIYRIDRIDELKILPEHFHIPYSSRFEEGEFRKRVQFMYGGKLRRIKFWYKGLSVEAVLDRLPTAVILEERDGKYLISAEVFGDGVYMWLRSQGDQIELL